MISRPVSRVLYGAGKPARDGHSSGTPIARRLKQPTRMADPDRSGPGPEGLGPMPSLFGFAPGGVCRAVSVAGDAVRSYRTVSPLPRLKRNAPWRSVFCGTVPGLAPAGRYPAPFVRGARTFLSGGLSALAGAAVRPTDALSNGQCDPNRQGPRRGDPIGGNAARASSSLFSVSRVEVSAMPSIWAGRK